MILPDIGDDRGDHTQVLHDLERTVVEARSARRNQNAAIGEGGLRIYDSGGLTIDDGGEIHMRGGGSFRGDDGGNFLLMHPGNQIAAVSAGTFNTFQGVTYGVSVWTRERALIFNASQGANGVTSVLCGGFTDPIDTLACHTKTVRFTTHDPVGEIRLESGGGVVSMPGLVSSAVAGVPVHINATTGRLYQFTSSARFKQDITDAGDLTRGVLGLRPRRFRHRDDVAADPGSTAATGFIAEEVDTVLPEAVVKNAAGEAEGIRETAIVTGLVQLVQKQQKQIDELTRRVAALEGN